MWYRPGLNPLWNGTSSPADSGLLMKKQRLRLSQSGSWVILSCLGLSLLLPFVEASVVSCKVPGCHKCFQTFILDYLCQFCISMLTMFLDLPESRRTCGGGGCRVTEADDSACASICRGAESAVDSWTGILCSSTDSQRGRPVVSSINSFSRLVADLLAFISF